MAGNGPVRNESFAMRKKTIVSNVMANGTDQPMSSLVASSDGLLTFRLERIARGLCVTRQRLRESPRHRLDQTALFADSESFERWMDLDEGRFHYPLVHLSARRAGVHFLRQDDRGTTP